MIRAVSLLALVLVGAGPARAEPQVPTITVEGRASLAVVPDTAVVSLGVITNRAKAADAMADNTQATKVLLDQVKAAGIGDQDVSTTAVDLTPTYRPSDNQVTGYQASNMLEISIRPTANAGALVSRLADKGANAIEGIAFVVSPDPKREDALRVAAMQDARHKAEVYVEALGLRLGRLLSITPQDTGVGAPRAFRTAAGRGAPMAVPLAAGRQDQETQVSVTFEILEEGSR